MLDVQVVLEKKLNQKSVFLSTELIVHEYTYYVEDRTN